MVSERLIQIWKEKGMFDKLKEHGIVNCDDVQNDSHQTTINNPQKESLYKKKDLYLEKKILESLGEDRYSRLSKKINEILRNYLIETGRWKE